MNEPTDEIALFQELFTLYTSGPWIVDQGFCHGLEEEALAVLKSCHMPGKRGEAVCVISLVSKSQHHDYANARLIAAAPDMLEALCTGLALAKIDGGSKILARMAVEKAIGKVFDTPNEVLPPKLTTASEIREAIKKVVEFAKMLGLQSESHYWNADDPEESASDPEDLVEDVGIKISVNEGIIFHRPYKVERVWTDKENLETEVVYSSNDEPNPNSFPPMTHDP